MILNWGYQANGWKPQGVIGMGFIVRRVGTDAAVTVTATLVGVWRNPITIEATGPVTIYAGNLRTTIEAGGTVDA